MRKQGGTWAVKLGERFVRCVWNYEAEEWYYSAVDLVQILIRTSNPTRYWSDFKRRLLVTDTNKLSREFYAKCVKLYLVSESGQKRRGDTLPGAELLVFWELLGCPSEIDFRRWSYFQKYAAKRQKPHRQGLKRVL